MTGTFARIDANVNTLVEDGRVRGVFIQTEDMKNSFLNYPDFVCLDATHKLTNKPLSLMVFLSENAIGKGEVAAVALLASENAKTFEWLLNAFKENNIEGSTKIRCFMADKDIKERNKLKETFPGAPVYICR